MKHFIEFAGLEINGAIEKATVAFLQTTYLTLAFTEMKAGGEVPLHQDLQESIDIVLEGTLEMQIGAETGILSPGMMSFIPENVPHRAKAITDCKVVTVIHPQRNIPATTLPEPAADPLP